MPQPPTLSPSVSQAATRFEFLDLLRGVAVLIMIEGHTMRALLDPEMRATLGYDFHELFHGLPAPLFLFGAGAAFAFTIRSASPRPSAAGSASRMKSWRRLLRLWNVLLIAYGMQLTYFSLVHTVRNSTPQQISILLNFNVLQCIVASVLALQLVSRLAASRVALIRACIWLTIAIGAATPLVWAGANRLPLGLATIVSRQHGSFFPLFPYAAFALAGAAWGAGFLNARERDDESGFLRRTIIYGGMTVVISTLVAGLPWPELYSDFWWSSPSYLFLRIGLLALLCAYARRAELAAERMKRPGLKLLALLGRQSFYIYVAHLLVLYGSSYNPNWNMLRKLGGNLPLGESAAASTLLAAAMIATAIPWDWAKRTHPWRASAVKWTLAAYLLIKFMVP